MAAAGGRSLQLQQLCRAAFSLCNAASTSAAAAGCSAAASGLRAAACGGSFGGVQQHASAAAGLRQLARHFHASVGQRQAAEGDGAASTSSGGSSGPAMNPLQQAPAPASAKAAPPGASPFGSADFGLGGGGGPGEGGAGNTSRAVTRGLSISAQKLNDFAKVVRGLHIEDAMIQCAMSPKKSAKIVENTLLSAKANAITNQGFDADRLRVAEAWVGKGSHLKRISMHGRGRSGRRLRYRCHLTVILREEDKEPKRKTKIVPMLMERQQKVLRPRIAAATQQRGR